jgi:hypothetical protein
MNHVIQLKQHSICVKNIYKKTKPVQDLSQKPLYDNHSANNYNIMKPELENVSFSYHKMPEYQNYVQKKTSKDFRMR